MIVPPTAVATSITPLSTESPEPTSTPETAREPVVNLATLTVPTCRTDPTQGGQVGFGTVPRTALFPDGIGTEVMEGENSADVVRALGPMVSWLRAATEFADAAWNSASSEQDYARAILSEGQRIWLLCGAVAATSDPVRYHPLTLSLAAALESMENWLTDRLETLRTDATQIHEADDSRELVSARLRGFRVSVEDLAADLETPDLANPGTFTVQNALLGAAMDVPAGWFVLRNDIDILLAAPFSYQKEGVAGLGVPGWNAGTAIRVRRFRHEEPWALSDTLNLMDSLYVGFGAQTGESLAVVDGRTAVMRTHESSQHGWASFVAATAVDQRSYLIELGCPQNHSDRCAEQFQELVAGIRLTLD